MGQVKDFIENIEEGKGAVKKIVQLAAPRMWSRLLLMATVGVGLMGGCLIYITLLAKDYADKTDAFLKDYEWAQVDSRDQRALDYITLCADAQKDNDANKDYYCQDAVAFYLDAFPASLDGKVGNNIKRAAYGAMKVEIKNKLRLTALQKLDKKAPEKSAVFDFLLSPLGVFLICLVGSLAMLGTAVTTFLMSQRNHSQD